MKNGEETKLLLHLLLKFLLCDENKTGKFALIYRMSQKNVSAIFGMSIIIQFMHNYIVYPKWGLLHFLLVLNVIEKIFLVKLFIDVRKSPKKWRYKKRTGGGMKTSLLFNRVNPNLPFINSIRPPIE